MSPATTIAPIGAELAAISRRTRRGLGASFLAHVAILLGLWLSAPEPASDEGLVEISWIEAPALDPPPPAPSVAARVTRQSAEGSKTPAKPAPRAREERFPREMPRAQIAPQPQRERNSRDAVRARLAATQRDATESRTQIAALLPSTTPRPALASAPAVADEPDPHALVRSESRRPSPAPAQLVRAASDPAPPRPQLARLLDEPAVRSAAPVGPQTFRPREVLAGVSLGGPIVDRALVDYRLPAYPDWAKRDAIEGSVRLRFAVRSDGGVKEDVMIEKTSGFEDFDRNATFALLDWRFEAVPGVTEEQWGSITFAYRLEN